MVCELYFMVSEWILLKISPMMGIIRFDKKGKFSLRFIGLLEILGQISKVAYEPFIYACSFSCPNIEEIPFPWFLVIWWDSVYLDQN